MEMLDRKEREMNIVVLAQSVLGLLDERDAGRGSQGHGEVGTCVGVWLDRKRVSSPEAGCRG